MLFGEQLPEESPYNGTKFRALLLLVSLPEHWSSYDFCSFMTFIVSFWGLSLKWEHFLLDCYYYCLAYFSSKSCLSKGLGYWLLIASFFLIASGSFIILKKTSPLSILYRIMSSTSSRVSASLIFLCWSSIALYFSYSFLSFLTGCLILVFNIFRKTSASLMEDFFLS